MANEPRLIKGDGTTQTPGDTPMTRNEFLEAVKAIVAMQAGAADVAAQKTDAVVDALQHIRSDINKGEYNIANFPNVSAFNPLGENKTVGGRPRPQFPKNTTISWVGTPVIWHEQTYEEMVLLLQLEPGIYHNGEWVVVDRQPGVRGSKDYRVDFPCKTADERSALPSDYWDANAKDEDGTPLIGLDPDNPHRKGRRVTGMEIMLREMVEEAASRVPATA